MMFEEYQNKLQKALWDKNIPSYMHEGIIGYVMHGRSVGDFLNNVFANSLTGAVAHADSTNKYLLANYALLIYNDLPQNSWGSVELVKAWREAGGLNGKAK